MGRHGILRDPDQPGDFPGGQAIGLVADEQPETVEPRGLCEGG